MMTRLQNLSAPNTLGNQVLSHKDGGMMPCAVSMGGYE